MSVGLLILALGWAGARARAEEPKSLVDVQLRAVLSGGLPKLGVLEPWQKVLFQEEVLAQPQRFVKNYQLAASGKGQNQETKAEVDSDSIRAYLKFHGTKSPDGQLPTAVVLLKPDLACSVCTQSLPMIRSWVRNRLEKRGLRVDQVSSEEIYSPLTSASSEDPLKSLTERKNAAVLVLVQWAPVALEDLDSAHADEKKYRLSVEFRALSTDSLHLTPFTVKKEKEILDLESFELSLGRVWSDAMTELGSKMEAGETHSTAQDTREYSIEISGIRDFQQLKKIRALLEARLKDFGVLEDRIISHQKFVFAISTHKDQEELRRVLSQLPADSGVGSLFHWVVQ